MINAWLLEYLGDAHKVLLMAIDEIHGLQVQQHYAKIVLIAQSSGTGKSRTVDKVSTIRILFPLCLREHLGDNYFGMSQE